MVEKVDSGIRIRDLVPKHHFLIKNDTKVTFSDIGSEILETDILASRIHEFGRWRRSEIQNLLGIRVWHQVEKHTRIWIPDLRF
jgi:hypothetical protein